MLVLKVVRQIHSNDTEDRAKKNQSHTKPEAQLGTKWSHSEYRVWKREMLRHSKELRPNGGGKIKEGKTKQELS